MPVIPKALQLFWDKGIKQVSPGALGMVIRGDPFDDDYGELVTKQYSEFCKWETLTISTGYPDGCEPKQYPTTAIEQLNINIGTYIVE